MIVYELDGSAFGDFSGFADHFSAVVLRDHRWNGNLDALNDILRGGFGTPDGGFVLRIRNVRAARLALGYPATASWLEQHLATCHPDNREDFRARPVEAKHSRGPTLFDTILEIIREHGPGGTESEDNVVLVLEDPSAE